MLTITIDKLSAGHLEHYYSIVVLDPSEEAMYEVWKSNKLIPFVSADSAATEMKKLYVQVSKVDHQSIENIQDKIALIDPMGRRRLLQGFSPANNT